MSVENVNRTRSNKLIWRIIGWVLIGLLAVGIYNSLPVLLVVAFNLVYLIVFVIILIAFLYLIVRLIR